MHADSIGLARALATAYLVPLLLLLASAQLSTLARIRYMSDVKSTLPGRPEPSAQHSSMDEDEVEPSSAEPTAPTTGGWLRYFSVEAMGLAEYVEDSTPSPISSITNLFAGLRATDKSKLDVEEKETAGETEAERADAERLYLTYSWWLLHQGWQALGDQVEVAVERIFAK